MKKAFGICGFFFVNFLKNCKFLKLEDQGSFCYRYKDGCVVISAIDTYFHVYWRLILFFYVADIQTSLQRNVFFLIIKHFEFIWR